MTRKNSLTLFNWYFIFSIAYYLFGKYHWDIPSYTKLLCYIFVCYLFLNIGYRYRPSRGQGGCFTLMRDYSFSLPPYGLAVRRLFWISSISLIVFQVVWVVIFFDRFSISNVFATLGDNYYTRLDKTFDSPIPIMQIRTLLWGLTLFSYPIGFLYYSKMPNIDRILLAVTLVIDVLAALNMGISKNIGDIVIIFIGILLLKRAVEPPNFQKRKGYAKSTIVIVICITVFLVFFSIIQNLRDASTTGNVVNPYGNFASLNDMYALPFLSDTSLGALIDRFGLYISHAYTGLAYALELPFQGTYLLGFSRSLMDYVNQIFGVDLESLTYNARIDSEYGWHNGQWWPTAFVWLGNAVSLWLVPFIAFALGIFFRYLEDDFAASGNVITAALYCQMVITLIYLPCNMQIFQSRASLMGTILLFILFINRKRLISSISK